MTATVDTSFHLNPLGMIWHVAYSMLSTVTGVVGITPLQLAEGVGGLLVTLILWQVVQQARNRTTFTLHDDEG